MHATKTIKCSYELKSMILDSVSNWHKSLLVVTEVFNCS